MEEGPSHKKRVRDDSDELGLDSPEVKRIREDLLDVDSDPSETTPEDLDSFMKSFQEEISASPTPLPVPAESGESRTDLGYLLEASDDELGLPPSTSLTPVREAVASNEEQEGTGFGELWKLDDEFLSYDSFEFGIGGGYNNYNFNGGEYVALDGLFDYSDFGDAPELLVRPETLPAQ